jgi:hypothetical protein
MSRILKMLKIDNDEDDFSEYMTKYAIMILGMILAIVLLAVLSYSFYKLSESKGDLQSDLKQMATKTTNVASGILATTSHAVTHKASDITTSLSDTVANTTVDLSPSLTASSILPTPSAPPAPVAPVR